MGPGAACETMRGMRRRTGTEAGDAELNQGATTQTDVAVIGGTPAGVAAAIAAARAGPGRGAGGAVAAPGRTDDERAGGDGYPAE